MYIVHVNKFLKFEFFEFEIHCEKDFYFSTKPVYWVRPLYTAHALDIRTKIRNIAFLTDYLVREDFYFSRDAGYWVRALCMPCTQELKYVGYR